MAVNDDPSVRRLKGPDRPLNTLSDRLAVLSGLAAVDWVVPFSEDTPERLICRLLPDLLAYLDDGGRKIDTWYARHRMARADFSDMPDMFLNLNTPADRQLLEDRLAAAG